MKINSKTKLREILKVKGVEPILNKYKFPCISCPMAQMEMDILEVGAVCSMYGIDEKKLLEEINKLLEKKEKTKPKKK